MWQTIIAVLLAILIILWFMRGYFVQRMIRIPAISNADLELLMQEEDAVLVDVRRDKEYRKGHIPGAVHVDAEVAEKEFPKLYPDRDHPYIFYCTAGVRSDIVMDQLKRAGYTNLHSYKRLKRYNGELEQA